MRTRGGVARPLLCLNGSTSRKTSTLGGASAILGSMVLSVCARGKPWVSQFALLEASTVVIGQSAGMLATASGIATVACAASEPIVQARARLMNWAQAKPTIITAASHRRNERTVQTPKKDQTRV